ncbi:hypothetical protein VAS14_16337 [Vibrio angustum S14]|uniref:Uncharacterized protein n=1 Tax=Photobacterium angustum (strain S14 / CCUG 15956) TaxID=314292 RepID=Q1ZM73_PHOAS|nr:hypothetical protein VAS14_16337 [Vibrio angustum S14] [Photobacterium angustum S14]
MKANRPAQEFDVHLALTKNQIGLCSTSVMIPPRIDDHHARIRILNSPVATMSF